MRRMQPSFHAAVLATCWTWRVYVRPLSYSTPRILMESCRANLLPSRKMLGGGKEDKSRRREISIIWVLSGANVTCHLLLHAMMFWSAFLMWEIAVRWSSRLHVKEIVQSSAYANASGISWRISLKKTFHSKGPRTLPWGTEALMGHSVEECPFTTTERDLPWR